MTARYREDAGVREARRLAGAAELAWRGHAGRDPHSAGVPCTQCSVASARRRYDALCPAGATLHHARLDAQAALARERTHAAQPDPAQGVLFNPDQPGG